MAVDEVGDELDVVNTVRVAAVERLVARDERADLHRLRLLRRASRVHRRGDEFPRAQRGIGHEHGVEQHPRAPRDVERVAGAVGHDGYAVGGDRPGRISRRPVDVLRELGEPRVGRCAADPEVAAPVGGQLEERCDPPRRDREGRAGKLEAHRRRDRRLDLRLYDRQILRRPPRRVQPHRQLDGMPLQARQRAHDRGGRSLAIEHAAGASGQDDRLQAVQDDRGFAVPHVDGARDLAEDVSQPADVDRRRRRNVGAEDFEVEALEAAERREARTLPPHGVHGGAPVGADSELICAQPPGAGADAERNRHVLHAPPVRLEA